MRFTDAIRGAWRRTVPTRLRRKVLYLWKSPGTEVSSYLHALRWKAMSQQKRVRWSREYNETTTEFWLFILGLHGSGTTLLKSILEQHPAIRSMRREGQYYTDAIPQVVTYGFVRKFTARLDLFRLTEADSAMAALRAQFDWSFVYPREKGIKLEKSSTNLIRARWLQAHFKPSRFITIFRDPYSVCASTRRRYPKFSIEDIAQQWKVAHDILLEDIQSLGSNVIVYYEDLCSHLEEELEKVSEFLELHPRLTRAMLPSLIPTAKNVYDAYLPVQNLNEESRSSLTAEEMHTIKRIAGGTISRVGYPPEAADGAGPVERLEGGRSAQSSGGGGHGA